MLVTLPIAPAPTLTRHRQISETPLMSMKGLMESEVSSPKEHKRLGPLLDESEGLKPCHEEPEVVTKSNQSSEGKHVGAQCATEAVEEPVPSGSSEPTEHVEDVPTNDNETEAKQHDNKIEANKHDVVHDPPPKSNTPKNVSLRLRIQPTRSHTPSPTRIPMPTSARNSLPSSLHPDGLASSSRTPSSTIPRPPNMNLSTTSIQTTIPRPPPSKTTNPLNASPPNKPTESRSKSLNPPNATRNPDRPSSTPPISNTDPHLALGPPHSHRAPTNAASSTNPNHQYRAQQGAHSHSLTTSPVATTSMAMNVAQMSPEKQAATQGLPMYLLMLKRYHKNMLDIYNKFKNDEIEEIEFAEQVLRVLHETTDKTDQQASRIRKLLRDHRNDSFRAEKKEHEESSSKQTSENAELNGNAS